MGEPAIGNVAVMFDPPVEGPISLTSTSLKAVELEVARIPMLALLFPARSPKFATSSTGLEILDALLNPQPPAN